MSNQWQTMEEFFPNFFRKWYIPILLLISLAIIIMQGWRVADPYYARDLKILMNFNSCLPAYKGYLFEGLLGDLIGFLFLSTGLSPDIVQYLWWITGVLLLTVILAVRVRAGSLDPMDLLLLLAFSRLIDLLSLYVGKFDPFLVLALVVSTDRNNKIAMIGILFAALLHPFVTVFSTAGIMILRATFENTWFYVGLILALLVSALNIALFRSLFPFFLDRQHFVTTQLVGLLHHGARWGLATLIGSILVPFLMISYFKKIGSTECKFQNILLILWSLLVVVLSCLFVTDHTRVACLVTIAPAIVFLRSQKWRDHREERSRLLVSTFAVFFAARLVIPHIDYEGLQLAGGCTQCAPFLHLWSLLHGT